MSNPTSLTALADFLEDRREQIITHWMGVIREDRKIPITDEMPRKQLIDHLPKLLENLSKQLRAADAVQDEAGVETQAEIHGEQRWEQQYRLDELLGELSILRLVIMKHLAAFRRENPGAPQETEEKGEEIVHAFLDRMALDSTVQFVVLQQEELKTANQSLGEAQAHGEQLNARLVEQDQRRLRMLRTITHEVRNHLNGISIVVTMLKEEEDTAVFQEYLGMLSRNLLEISGLINQLLDFAALLSDGEAAVFARCNPGALHAELSLVLEESARAKGLDFHGTTDLAIGDIITDRSKLYRIAMNLVSNAIKYTPQGQVRMDFTTMDHDGRWCLEVKDTGPGIPDSEKEKIYDEFHRVTATTGDQPGAGLGLAITKQLVALLGGTIDMKSEVGKGTQFKVIFPREPRVE